MWYISFFPSVLIGGGEMSGFHPPHTPDSTHGVDLDFRKRESRDITRQLLF
jgi:hypothetical protein